MPFPTKTDDQKRKAFGISLDRTTVDRIDALLGAVPGKRSEKYRGVLIDGMEQRFGRDWERIADAIRAGDREQVPA